METRYTICWDCKRAIGECRWSSSLKPVKGWTAEKTKSKCGGDSYVVIDCPEFIRDAYNMGLKRYKGEPDISDTGLKGDAYGTKISCGINRQ